MILMSCIGEDFFLPVAFYVPLLVNVINLD